MHISCAFEQGKIGIVDATDPGDIRLELPTDNASHFFQWFFFRVTAAKNTALTMTFVNAIGANRNKTQGMPDTWPDYQAFASYDLEEWFLVPTEVRDDGMTVRFTPAQDSIFFAQYPPYSMERGRRLVARALQDERVNLTVLGQTPDGQDLEVLTVGTAQPGRRACWITTRQHPNEIQGSWCVEGLLERLLDREDPISRVLLEKAVFHIVPNMNPDGALRGNTRTNALGANLNREWRDPKEDFAPEVLYVKRAMEAWGIDFYLDVHAWAGTHPYVGGPYRTPSITPKQEALWTRFEAALAKANPEFQTGNPYPGGGPPPGGAYLEMSWNYVNEFYGAFGVLYELIFKNNALRPDPVHGWSPAKCRHFGRTTLDALYAVVDDLGR